MPNGFALLGLTGPERAGYELLMDGPAATLPELLSRWTRPEPLEPILAGLEERSLVTCVPGPPARYRAVAPGSAFDALLVEYQERLERARRHIGTLDAAYQARPATREATSVVEVVTGQRAVRDRLRQITRGARSRIGLLAKPPHFPELGLDRGPLRRGLVCRTIYDRSAIEHPGALSAVEESIQAGLLARVLPDLPVSLYLADDRTAVLSLQRHPTSEAIIVVHPSALLDALVKLFDGLWSRAMPLDTPPASTDAGTQRLITLLLSGLTDEAIAHQLGLSHRTVQRRVAALMADLGAHTRFQAGVRAALERAADEFRPAAGSL
jgi:sugar-specific transcriptional regulator TrmB